MEYAYIQAINDADGHVASQNALGCGNNYFIYDGDHIVEVLNSDGTTNEIFGYGADGMRQGFLPESSDGFTYTYDPQGNLVEHIDNNYGWPIDVNSYYPTGPEANAGGPGGDGFHNRSE